MKISVQSVMCVLQQEGYTMKMVNHSFNLYNCSLKFFVGYTVKGFTPLCLTWAALDGDGLVFALPLWIPPEV